MEAKLLFVVLALEGLILVSLWAIFVQVLKQRGRMLLRLDTLEGRLAFVNQLVAREVQAPPAELAVGTPVESFRLPDLTGRTISLEDYAGEKVLLIHWSPGCGYCDLIATDLAKLQPDLEQHNIRMLLLSHGDEANNRELAEEHGLNCPILLLRDAQPPVRIFEDFGTPVAYLLDEAGRIASPLAQGAEQIPDLARAALAAGNTRKRLPDERPLAESHIEREGLKAGALAPTFNLPDLYGQMVSLEAYRGHRVLLVFSDPHCGPCDGLAPHLVRLNRERRPDDLAVVMVGRGDPEENRLKAEQYGFEFPVVLQRKWELSKQYGIFATPVAFLIDENGKIAQDVAKGPDQILALVTEKPVDLRR